MRTLRICVYGIVQGVGFRPFVSRIADRIGVLGSVANRGSYVEIFAQASDEALESFANAIKEEAPERSAILKLTQRVLCETDDEAVEKGYAYSDFQIIESERESGDIFVSPDIATCPKCKAELFDPANRRYMHPFINCTACGPRLTILDAMPYDRERTSMKDFPMCPSCEYEYTHAETRRYDAQPVCCNDCGPKLYLLGRPERGREALTAARRAITEGKIIAIKGIGGFHLCCDAMNEAAVARLRKLKRRPAKPFAIMARDIEATERICEIPNGEIRELLDGHQKPIILLNKRNNLVLAPSLAPGNPKLGVMLPYAPVQMLLFDYNDGLELGTDYLVMTSGNISGAPICRTDEDATKEISGFCDLILSHDRTIRMRADDSVVDVYKGEPYMIRRSRGYAPLPVMSEEEYKGSVLAVGGELKNSFCIGKDSLLYASPYVGDMEDIRTVRALAESITRMEELLETEPEIVACDMHPKYNTTLVAEKQSLPILRVQHHYAHILSCMAENDYRQKVIGISLDGTGYGTDGSIWGGEILSCDLKGFERLGSISPFTQVGGDLSAKEGFRVASSMLAEIYGEKSVEYVEELGICDGKMHALISKMAKAGLNSVKSTSAGRLFDSASAILGIKRKSSFEGEASMSLQFAAEEYRELVGDEVAEKEAIELMAKYGISSDVASAEDCNVRSDLIIRMLVEDMLADKTSASELVAEELRASAACEARRDVATLKLKLAYAFHFALAKRLVAAAICACKLEKINTVALSGGVFQNTLLLGLVEDELEGRGVEVLRHHMIPPNDGGLCLGQAAAAMSKLNDK